MFITTAYASSFSTHYPPISVMERYILQRAPFHHINPQIALRVAHSEGLNIAGQRLGYKVHDPVAFSYGPYQLHDGGLANQFGHPTGANWKRQIDFSLNYALHNGWGSWYGAARVGVGKHCGINGGGCGRFMGSNHVNRWHHRHHHANLVWKDSRIHRQAWHRKH